MEFFTTIENQLREDGSYGLLYDHFTEKNAALAKYYTICAAAAVSKIPYHAAVIWSSDGRIVKEEIFDRRTVPEPEPETEEEPETAGE